MLGTSIDIALGMAMYFLWISVVCSTLVEWIQGMFSIRGLQLLLSLEEVLSGRDARWKLLGACIRGFAKKEITTDSPVWKLYQSETMRAVTPLRFPAYIDSAVFATAVEAGRKGEGAKVISKVSSFIGNSPDAVRKPDIERWFDMVNERITGSFKRKNQVVIGLMALFVVLAADLNAVSYFQELKSAPVKAAKLAAKSEGLVEKLKLTKDQKSFSAVSAELETFTAIKPEGDSSSGASGPFPIIFKRFNSVQLFEKLVGYFITILAASFGAPFWFDLVSRIANIRLTGPKPDDKDKLPSKSAT